MSPIGRFCCKSIFGGWTEILRAADASRASRCEGPYRFTQKRPRTFVSAPRTFAAIEIPKNRSSRDFWRRTIFDFCNKIGTKRTSSCVAPCPLLGVERTSFLDVERSASDPGCVKTCASGEVAELFSSFPSLSDLCQSCSSPIQLNREKASMRESDAGVFTQPGPKADIRGARRQVWF